MDAKTEQLYQEYLNEKFAQIFEKKSYSQKVRNTHREISKRHNYVLRPKSDFSESKYVIIGPDGKRVNDKIIYLSNPSIHEFKDGLARVVYRVGFGIESHSRYNFIDTEGNFIKNGGYLFAGDFYDGYAEVSNGEVHYFIDKKGIILENLVFDNAWPFCEGLARVMYSDGTYNFINTKGEKLCKKNFTDAGDFSEGLAYVCIGGIHTYIDKKGNPIPSTGYKFNDGEKFYEGFAVVKQGNKYNYIDRNGNPLSKTSFHKCYGFSNGWGLIETEKGINFINKHGDLISKEYYDDAYDFEYGLAIIGRNHKLTIINTKGERVIDEWFDEKTDLEIQSSTAYRIGKKCYNINEFIRKNNVITTKRGYTIMKNGVAFDVKFEPVMVYGTRYVLCKNKNGKNLVLYDKTTNKYQDIGSIEAIDYDENFIINHRTNSVDLFYRDQRLDVTEYYYDNLMEKEKFYITEGVPLLTKEDFMISGECAKRDSENKKKEKNKEIARQQKEAEEKIALLQLQKILRDKEIKTSIENALTIIQEKFEELERLYKETGIIGRVKLENAIKDVGNHREINPIILKLGWLMFVDFTGETFEKVKMSGIDFRNCNINSLKPQEVDGPDLSNCNFEGIHFDPMTQFAGVNICNTKFSDDNDERTPDIMPNFNGAIYDDRSTYNGEKIGDILARQNAEQQQSGGPQRN